MKINIRDIFVKERIRKDINKIEELAVDIRRNGLINPITVMPFTGPDNGGEYQLLAGLRRIRAVQSLGWSEIDANVITPKDAEEALRIEISENEQREQFTPSERLDYGRQLERLETAKALERKAIGGQGGFKEDTDHGPYLERGEKRNIIGRKLGMSGKQYDRLKYIGDNAPAKIMDQLDRGERTIRGTYDELRAEKRAASKPEGPPRERPSAPMPELFTVEASTDTESATSEFELKPTPDETVFPEKSGPFRPAKLSGKAKEERAMAILPPKEREAVERHNAFVAMTPEQKIVELQFQLKTERCRAITAETELSRLKDELHNAVYHRDGIISNLERQLEAAHARIQELEGEHESGRHTA